MSAGGRRPGAGRPRGAISLSTRAILESILSGGEMPLGYMLRVMRDENEPDRRRDKMAKAAAAYLHARLALLPDGTADEPEDDAMATEEGEAAKEGAC